jgi:hypothetical protein
MLVTRGLRLESSSITGNTPPWGIYNSHGGAIRLDNSTVTGHTIDLLSVRRPRLINSTCGTSSQLSATGPTWGVCTND